MEFSEKLRRLAKAKGWNQRDVMRAVGDVSRTKVNNWFSGKFVPDLRESLRLARAFGVSLDYLADDAVDAPPEQPDRPSDMEIAIRSIIQAIGLPESLRRLSCLIAVERDVPAEAGSWVGSITFLKTLSDDEKVGLLIASLGSLREELLGELKQLRAERQKGDDLRDPSPGTPIPGAQAMTCSNTSHSPLPLYGPPRRQITRKKDKLGRSDHEKKLT
jgi:transcriptional regulator with XRE-family HTH domain